jgi:hypothetical protein
MAHVQTSVVDTKLASTNMDHDILHAERALKNKQLLIRPFL